MSPYVCASCDDPIDDDWPHTDPVTGEDVHEACCRLCHPELAGPDAAGLPTLADFQHSAAQRLNTPDAADIEITGHGTPTREQTAAAEAARWLPAP